MGIALTMIDNDSGRMMAGPLRNHSDESRASTHSEKSSHYYCYFYYYYYYYYLFSFLYFVSSQDTDSLSAYTEA